MMDIQKLKHLASEADRQVTWSLVPFDLHKDEWETDVVNYIGAISPATITDLLNRLEKAEAQLAELAKQEPTTDEANHCALVLEYIGQFESEDIDSDTVDMRFEIDGLDTGSDVSITEYATRSAKVIRGLLSRAAPPAPVKLPAVVTGHDCPDHILDKFSWMCGAGWMREKIIENIKAAGGSEEDE